MDKPLALAAGQAPRWMGGKGLKSVAMENPGHGIGRCSGGRCLLLHRWGQELELGGWQHEDGSTVAQNTAPSRLLESRQHPGESRLTGSVRTAEQNDLSLAKNQVTVREEAASCQVDLEPPSFENNPRARRGWGGELGGLRRLTDREPAFFEGLPRRNGSEPPT